MRPIRRKKKVASLPINSSSASLSATDAVTAEPADMASMSLRDHLVELRSRLLRCFISVFVMFAGVFYFAPRIRAQIESLLRTTLPPGGEITFIDITEPFMVDMRIAFIVGIFAASPYIFYQIWSFIAPGLYPSERKYIVPLALCSAIFFLAGGAFSYSIAIPYSFRFFIGYGSGSAPPLITMSNMFSYALRLIFAFGLICEMPLFCFFLAKLRILTAFRMRVWRKYAILASFVLAAIITPPDIYSQLMMAGPLVLLYELSILVVKASQPKSISEPAVDAPG